MTETILVLIIFFILLVLGVVFYVKVAGVTSTRKGQELFEVRAVELAHIINQLPELQCSKNAVEKADCIDFLKLKTLKTLINDYKPYYLERFGKSKTNITIVYPLENRTKFKNGLYEDTLYDFTQPDAQQSLPFFRPITLYDAKTDEFYFGYLQIEVQK